MHYKPLVSIIIPAYNAQSYIAETLNSILAQSYSNMEIIVVDDGSTDMTSPIVQGFGPGVRYYRQENSGSAAAPRNVGIGYSSGEYISFMDADDIMASDRLEHQASFMEHHPEVGLVFSNYRNFSENGPHPVSHFQTCPRLRTLLVDRDDAVIDGACAMLVRENFGCAGTLMIRRNMLASEAGFVPTLEACEDFHFYYRLARISPVGVIKREGLMRRLHGGNISGNPFKMLSERIRSRSMLRDTENDPEARANLDDYIAECRVSLACYHADNGKFRESLACNFQALAGRFCLGQVGAFSRTAARTVLIALGLHKSRNALD